MSTLRFAASERTVMPRLAIATALLCISTTASAQSIAIDEFRPAIDSRGYLTLNASQTLGHGEMSFGLGSLQWGRKLLSFEAGPATYSVDNMISATLVAALGLHLGDVPLEVGASLPFTIMNGSRGPDALGDPNNPNDDKLYRLDGQGLGDVGIHLKARLARVGRFGFGAIGSLYVPTSASRDPFLGEAAVTPQLVGVADATFGAVRFAINAGIRFRRTTTFMDLGSGGAPATMGSITTSTALPAGVAAAWSVVPEKIELVGEVFGAIPVGQHHGYQSLEALGGVKVYLAKNSFLSLGAGRGLVPGEAGNPDFRAVIGIVFEPKAAQRMTGNVPDEDGTIAMGPPVKHDDGLGDRDNDGIFDKDDKCPDDPENYNGVDDEDGCPEQDRPMVVETESELVTLQPIEFEFDKAVLRTSAFPILKDVVKALNDNPTITLIEVQGHTDEQGNDGYNLDLSNRRAATVMKFLADSGIDARRLTSQGYGETQPVDLRHTQEAYKLNRRVAFIIKHRD
jgi:outer membrane protein OmpA-like peptidoglycan-associated protein